MGFKDWETPPDFFKAVNDELHFTLDAMSSHRNHLCPQYSTLQGTYIQADPEFADIEGPTFVSGHDGLDLNWFGLRVWCNPPYDGTTMLQVIEKAAKREAELAVLLLPPSVDTEWYHLLLSHVVKDAGPELEDFEILQRERWGHQWSAIGTPRTGVWTMKGRLRFWRPPSLNSPDQPYVPDYSKPSEPGPSPTAGNMLAIFRR